MGTSSEDLYKRSLEPLEHPEMTPKMAPGRHCVADTGPISEDVGLLPRTSGPRMSNEVKKLNPWDQKNLYKRIPGPLEHPELIPKMTPGRH